MTHLRHHAHTSNLGRPETPCEIAVEVPDVLDELTERRRGGIRVSPGGDSNRDSGRSRAKHTRKAGLPEATRPGGTEQAAKLTHAEA
jgi:hypothetical protein